MQEQHKTNLAYISLGSNIGDREQLLRQAIIQLHSIPSIDVVRCSSMYETDPVGFVEQSSFINMVTSITTTYSPQELFKVMLNIEKDLGRTRDIRWGPRTIDLDLLLFEDVEMETELLTIPHPRMSDRGFVLIPLAELYELEQKPGLKAIRSSIERLDRKDEVVLWKKNNWHSELGHFVN